LLYEKVPTIYYNNGFTTEPNDFSIICPETICSNISYSDGTLVFDVTSFSSFLVGDTLTCYAQNGVICSLADTCTGDWLIALDTNRCCSTSCILDLTQFNELDICEDVIGDLEVLIKEPDDGDEFKPKDSVDIKVKVKNNGEEDIDVVVETTLYDTTENKEIEKFESNEEEIDGGEYEIFELDLDIPDDIDEDNELMVYVKAYEDNKESENCVEDWVDIKVEIEKHDVVIDEFLIKPSRISCGDIINLNMDIENIGSRDEDEVYVRIENNELGIDERSE